MLCHLELFSYSFYVLCCSSSLFRISASSSSDFAAAFSLDSAAFSTVTSTTRTAWRKASICLSYSASTPSCRVHISSLTLSNAVRTWRLSLACAAASRPMSPRSSCSAYCTSSGCVPTGGGEEPPEPPSFPRKYLARPVLLWFSLTDLPYTRKRRKVTGVW